jgi:hypothetical protein
VLYAHAADVGDGSAERAVQISTDVDEIDGWFRREDSARTPRFDLAAFSCGAQADITRVRLALSGAQLADDSTRFSQLIQDPGVVRFSTAFNKLLIYYDGPVSDSNLCGQGGGAADGAGFAIVYLAACTDLSTASTAIHEVLHSFGAVARSGPPNTCSDSPSHVCDSTGDILWPFAQPFPLSSFVLDLNRDDYYAHNGPWVDVQDSAWLRRLDAQVPLDVLVRGAGGVLSDVPGIACTAQCRADFNAGTELTLAPQAAQGQRFVRWSGACAGGLEDCTLLLDGAKTITALFAPARFRLAVSVRGRGRVTSTAGIACPSRCTRDVVSHERVLLRAAPAKGWRLKAWSGSCRGSRATCTLPMTKASSARATFVRR